MTCHLNLCVPCLITSPYFMGVILDNSHFRVSTWMPRPLDRNVIVALELVRNLKDFLS